jgi:catechol 2,3-dioxygenase-like lactoylglutathione lyase family enzyme
MTISIEKIHHVAYRCNNARETVEFYQKHLGMRFILAISEDKVPSTKEPDPYMHVFLDAGIGNILAFFELPHSPAMDRDRNTPPWVQHIAFQLRTEKELSEAMASLRAAGLDVVGPTDHTIIKSIYFFDPNGHRIELTVPCATDDQMRRLDDVKWEMLEEWDRTRSVVRHADWLHR